jgi:hypothetical protein
MAIQVIISQAGPLPITVAFNAPGDEPMYLEINGSVWAPTAGQIIGIAAVLNGTVLGQAQICSNGSTTHRAVVPAYFQLRFSEGQQSLTLTVANSNTTSDSNDFYNAVLHY